MKNLKIKYKFAVTQLSIVLMLIIIGYCAISGTANLGSLFNNYKNVAYNLMSEIDDLTIHLYDITFDIEEAFLHSDLDTIKSTSSNFSSTLEEWKSSIQSSSNISDSEELNAAIASLPTCLDNFESTLQRVASASDLESAYAIYDTDFQTALNACLTSLASADSYASELESSQFTYVQNYSRNTTIALAVIMILGIVLCIVFNIILTNSFVAPLKSLERIVSSLAKGETCDTDNLYQSQDEIGELSKSLSDYISFSQDILSEVIVNLEAFSNGDFSITMGDREKYIGNFTVLFDSMERFVTQINGTLLHVNSVASQVSIGSNQVSNGAQMLAIGSTNQAAAIQEISTNITNVTTQVGENAANSKEASNYAMTASASAASCNDQMQELTRSMKEIEALSSEIKKINRSIEDIAFQTSILALNAAVEAAHAGSAGKGFAVVADEVRNLASKSAEAAQSTSKLIEHTLLAINTGVATAEITANTLSEVVVTTKTTTDLINAISEASDEQNTTISEILRSIEDISSVVYTNSATSEESAAASEELSSQSAELTSLVSKFNLKA